MIARDRHCTFPGCAQRPAACQVHHLLARSRGGPTALGNLALLCPFHHLIAIHRWGWSLTLHGDGTTTAVSPDGETHAPQPRTARRRNGLSAVPPLAADRPLSHKVPAMPADTPTILATSGGLRPGRRTEVEFSPLVLHAIELSGVTGRAPRLCHVGTACGDQRYFQAWYDAAGQAQGIAVSHLNLFSMPNVNDVRAHLLAQDVIWVGGGSVANLLALWRLHGVDQILRRRGRRAWCWPGCPRARSAGTSAAPPTRSGPSCGR